MNEQNNILDVLSGKTPVKVNVSINTMSIIYVALGIFLAIVAGNVLGHMVTSKTA